MFEELTISILIGVFGGALGGLLVLVIMLAVRKLISVINE